MSKKKVMKNAIKKMLKPLFYFLAMIYFLVDAVFMTVAVPAGRWLADRLVSNRIRNWIVSLRPYPTLMLFAVPVIMLEPVKPLAIYMIGTNHVVAGVTLFVLCEILKLVLVERLFAISREKLLSIPAFAWGYGRYSAAKHWIVSLEACRKVQKWVRRARCSIRRQIAVSRPATSLRRATPNPA
jgi:hypothetical protein